MSISDFYVEVAELAGLDGSEENTITVVAEATGQAEAGVTAASVAAIVRHNVQQMLKSTRANIVDFGTKKNLESLTAEELFVYGRLRNESRDANRMINNAKEDGQSLNYQRLLDLTESLASELAAISES